jgi:hypothetical protein
MRNQIQLSSCNSVEHEVITTTLNTINASPVFFVMQAKSNAQVFWVVFANKTRG